MKNSSIRTVRRTPLIKIFHKLYKFYGPQGWWPADGAFEMIAGAVLTQNTAWSNVEKAIANLKKRGLLDSPGRVSAVSLRELAGIIRPAGYYNLKAGRLKNFVRFLSANYRNSIVRMSREDTGKLREVLLGINGIGPETCDSILLYAFKRPVFVVDAYTKRIFSRHGLFAHDSAYADVQRIFMSGLPSDEKLFNEYHALIVRLAKEYCRKEPRCQDCPLCGVKLLAKSKAR